MYKALRKRKKHLLTFKLQGVKNVGTCFEFFYSKQLHTCSFNKVIVVSKTGKQRNFEKFLKDRCFFLGCYRNENFAQF